MEKHEKLCFLLKEWMLVFTHASKLGETRNYQNKSFDECVSLAKAQRYFEEEAEAFALIIDDYRDCFDIAVERLKKDRARLNDLVEKGIGLKERNKQELKDTIYMLAAAHKYKINYPLIDLESDDE